MADVRIEVTCPGCNKPFHVPPDEQGKVVECRHCAGWVDVPEVNPPPTPEADEVRGLYNTREYDRQMAVGARQLEDNARQIEQSQRALDKRDQQDARFDRLLDRMEAVIGQWDQLAPRMAKVMDRLEN